MKKEDLQHLVDSYDGKDHYKAHIKGFRKRFFGLKTDGMIHLEKFLNSTAIKSLNKDDLITGENLKNLITLLEERDERIRYTRRGYEAYPGKETNRIYQRIYILLAYDLISKEYLGNTTLNQSDLELINVALATRENHKRQYEFEQKAKQGDVDAAETLGIGLTSSKPVEFSDYQSEVSKYRQEILKTDVSEAPPKFIHEINTQNEKISIIAEVVGSAFIASLVIVSGTLKFKPDFKAGIKWLEYASDKGSKSASYHLAKLYANKEYGNDETFNKDKAVYYLKITADLGNETVIQLLREGGAFGKIVIPANTYESKNSLPKNVK